MKIRRVMNRWSRNWLFVLVCVRIAQLGSTQARRRTLAPVSNKARRSDVEPNFNMQQLASFLDLAPAAAIFFAAITKIYRLPISKAHEARRRRMAANSSTANRQSSSIVKSRKFSGVAPLQLLVVFFRFFGIIFYLFCMFSW